MTAYTVYDRYFKDHFTNFFYFVNFGETITAGEIYEDFTDAVQAFITLNAKRYSELYRVQVLASTAYDIVNNYDLNETHSRTTSGSASDTFGARSDSTSGTSTEGGREDSQSETAVDGARSDSGSTNVGAQNSTTTRQIEGFNSSSFSDADKDTTATQAHTDTTSVSKGQQTNTNDSTLIKGEQINTSSTTATKGAQSDSHTNSSTESITIRRYGNIGVQTPADVIGGHLELWDLFNFYKQIFDEIAKEYLILDDYYEYAGGEASASTDNIILEKLAAIQAQLASGFNAGAKAADMSSGFTAGAKASQITGLATSSELAAQIGAVREDVADVNTELTVVDNNLVSLELTVDQMRTSTLAYKNEIVDSIEGVSTEEY